jgi:hypothetical protein
MSSPAVGDKRPREREEHNYRTLIEHIARRDVEGVKADLDAGVDPNVVDTSSRREHNLPIGNAVFYWNEADRQMKDIVKLLLRSGADPNLPNPPRSSRYSPVIFDALVIPSSELLRLLLLDPDTRIKVDLNTKVDFPGGPYPLPEGWVPGPYSLREFIKKITNRPYLRQDPSERMVNRRKELLAIVDEAIQKRRADIGKALNQTPLNPDVLGKIADFDTPKGRGRRSTRGRRVHKKRRTYKRHGRK